jgi:hypothetical protein
MDMALSFVQYTANGSTDTFSISFPYLSTTHIEVRVDDVLETGVTFPTPTTCLLTSTPTNGQVVEVRRVTPRATPLVDFSDASTLTESDLDTNKNQLFYLTQEQIDTADTALILAGDGSYDAGSRKIKNVANPTNAQDAVTVNYLNTTFTSALNAAVAAAAADVVLTNADVVLTGLDVAATNADVVLTNADVVLTGLDVAATNADVVLTGLDVVATNADVVAAAASAAAAAATANGGIAYTDKTSSFSLGVTGTAFGGRYAVTASAALDISLDGSYTPDEGDWFVIKDVDDTFDDYDVRLVLDDTEFFDPSGDSFTHVKLDFKSTLGLVGSSYTFVFEDGKWRIE